MRKDVPPMWQHQEVSVNKALQERDLALFHEMGTGKTRTIIEVMRRQFARKGRVMRTLILGPLIVVENWKKEILDFSKVHPKDIITLDKSGKRRAHEFRKAVEVNHLLVRPRIVVTNYEAMQMDELFQLLKDWMPEILVCDESHRLKNVKSKRAKRVLDIAESTEHNYILTGTPILNTPLDIFNQYRVLDRGATFGQNFYAFRGRYFEDINQRFAGKPGYFPKFEARFDTFEKLNSLVYRKATRAVKTECLDLPPLVKEWRTVGMGPDQAKAYKEMRDNYVTFVESMKESGEPRAVIAQLAITKALRLQQIVSGFAKDDEGEIHTFKKVPRLDAVKELLEDLIGEHKVIVWAVFKENYRMLTELCKKIGTEPAFIHGGIGAKEKNENIETFRNDPKCRVMIANQGAGGIGINLVESSYSIFYSRSFSLEQDLQAEARNWRGGSEQHSSITRIDLVTPNTIDELISESLSKKLDVASRILEITEAL